MGHVFGGFSESAYQMSIDPKQFINEPIPMEDLEIIVPFNKDNFIPNEEEKIQIRRLYQMENYPADTQHRRAGVIII